MRCEPIKNPDEKPQTRLMSLAEQETYLRFYATGLTRNECCRATGVPNASDLLTAHAHPDFKEKFDNINKERKKQVETRLITLAVGAAQQVKEYWATIKGEGGLPKTDKDGAPLMMLQKKEVTKLAPNLDALKLWLAHEYPDEWGKPQLSLNAPSPQHQPSNDFLSIEEMTRRAKERLALLQKTRDDATN